MRTISTALFAVIAALTLSGCADLIEDFRPSSCETDQSNVVEFLGPMDSETVDTFLKCISGRQWDTLRIDTQGEQELPASKLARTLRELDYTLVVEGFCAASCATFVLPTASRVHLGDTGVIAYAPTMLAIQRTALASGFDVDLERDLVSTWTREHYEALGLDLILFDHIIASSAVTCVDTRTFRSMTGIGVHAEADLWVPPQDFIEAYLGRPLEGYPRDQDDIYQRIATLAGGEMRVSLRTVSSDPIELRRAECVGEATYTYFPKVPI